MGTMAIARTVETRDEGRGALKLATQVWFVTAVLGQMFFAFAMAAFYTRTASRGEWNAWNRFMTHGYVPGQPIGNGVVAVHLIGVLLLIVCGALQLMPQVLRRAPRFHRWNGRVYMVSALALSGAGVVMLMGRGSVGGFAQHVALLLNGLLIWGFAGLALRSALQRDFAQHRRWALRLYVVSLGVWFLRLAVPLWLIVFQGPVGMDFTTFTGPALVFWSFAAYLLPLSVMELYLRTQQRPSGPRRWAMASLLSVMTVAMGVGMLGAAAQQWAGETKTAFDSRRSIGSEIAATIASRGIDAGVARYRALAATERSRYNFDENELNDLGYVLLRARKYAEAVQIFELNVEAYPQSWNVYDSLGEAYADWADRPNAIANYLRSVQLNPNSVSGKRMLERLRVSEPEATR